MSWLNYAEFLAGVPENTWQTRDTTLKQPAPPKPMAPPSFLTQGLDFLKGTKPDAIVAGFSPDQINQDFSDKSSVLIEGANLSPSLSGSPSSNLPYVTGGKADMLGSALGTGKNPISWLWTSVLGWVVLILIGWLAYKAYKKYRK